VKKHIIFFLAERDISKHKQLSATIHRNQRKCFDSDQITTSPDARMKVAEMEKLGLASLLELVEKSGNVQLEAALESRVTKECPFSMLMAL